MPRPDILVVSVHARNTGVLSPIAGWQVIVLDHGDQRLVGSVHPRRALAMAFAADHFDDIVGWKRLESTAWIATRRADVPVSVPVSVPAARVRRSTGPNVPRWRAAAGLE